MKSTCVVYTTWWEIISICGSFSLYSCSWKCTCYCPSCSSIWVEVRVTLSWLRVPVAWWMATICQLWPHSITEM